MQHGMYKAVVEKIQPNGIHGPFAVGRPMSPPPELVGRGTITFSLDRKDGVWNERRWPEPGEIVMLGFLTEKPSGLRAGVAQFSTSGDRSEISSAAREPLRGNMRSERDQEKRDSIAGPVRRPDRNVPIAPRVPPGGRKVSVSVTFAERAGAGHQIAQINSTLMRSTREERLQLFKDLFRLWVEGKMRYEEARTVFGDVFKHHGTKPLLISRNTTSAGASVLRVWYDLPTTISAQEVSGSDLLFTVTGPKGSEDAIEEYQRAILSIYPIRRNTLKNGARIWINWGG